jgi:signal transduction histidine kinase
VIGDPDALRRALHNLVSNAMRIAPAGSTLTVASGREHGWAWAAVRDQGPGIAEADRERVFDRFWRGPDRHRPGEQRTGLGLAIVRQIAESHSGTVALHSSPGRGSTFVLWLPESPGEGATRAAAAPGSDPLRGH